MLKLVWTRSLIKTRSKFSKMLIYTFLFLFWFVCVYEMFQETMTHIKCAVTCIKNNTIIKKSTIKYSCHLFACGIEKLVHCHSHFTSAKVYRSAVVAMSLPLSTQTASLLLVRTTNICLYKQCRNYFLSFRLFDIIVSKKSPAVSNGFATVRQFVISIMRHCLICTTAYVHMQSIVYLVEVFVLARWFVANDECQT